MRLDHLWLDALQPVNLILSFYRWSQPILLSDLSPELHGSASCTGRSDNTKHPLMPGLPHLLVQLLSLEEEEEEG